MVMRCRQCGRWRTALLREGALRHSPPQMCALVMGFLPGLCGNVGIVHNRKLAVGGKLLSLFPPAQQRDKLFHRTAPMAIFDPK